MAREGACPCAPSRAPRCGVHWSEAKALDGRSGRTRRRFWPGRASDDGECQSCSGQLLEKSGLRFSASNQVTTRYKRCSLAEPHESQAGKVMYTKYKYLYANEVPQIETTGVSNRVLGSRVAARYRLSIGFHRYSRDRSIPSVIDCRDDSQLRWESELR